MITEEKYNQFLKEAYSLSREIEELEYISPRFLEIVNFYFERYGFGTKIKKPKRCIRMEKEYNFMTERLNDLKEEEKLIREDIEKYDKKQEKKK